MTVSGKLNGVVSRDLPTFLSIYYLGCRYSVVLSAFKNLLQKKNLSMLKRNEKNSLNLAAAFLTFIHCFQAELMATPCAQVMTSFDSWIICWSKISNICYFEVLLESVVHYSAKAKCTVCSAALDFFIRGHFYIM